MNKTTNKTMSKTMQYVALIIMALIMIFPVFWVLSSSLKTYQGLSAYPPEIFPSHPVFENYRYVLEKTNFLQYGKNTLLIVIFTTIGTLISSSFVGFGLARLSFRGRDLIFGLILATMMVPAVTTIVPQYLVFNKFGWLDTLLPMIVPTFFAAPYNVFLFRQFFKTMPKEIDEAALLDGCSWFQIFFKIYVPLAKPIFIVVMVLSSIFWWNELFMPLIFTDSENMKTLTLGAMSSFTIPGTQGVVAWNLQMAMSMLMIIPPVILYLIASKYIVGGIKATGSK